MTKGWAVADPKGIIVKTVSETRRGAIGRALMVYAGLMISTSWEPADIETTWERCAEENKLKVLEVTISAAL